ncbi:MAG: energy-coupling factor ABC transporter ATP-binding protein [Lachnospiraceae bacterium]
MKSKQNSHPMIKMDKVSFFYDAGHLILKDISISVKQGESVGVIGANGKGKSTLLRLLTGIHMAASGSIYIDGIRVEKSSLKQIRRRTGYMFQDSENQLFMSRVEEDVAFGPKNQGMTGIQLQNRIDMALDTVGASYLYGKQIYKLSGGEKKMIAIASILSMEPSILLLDEPTIALDPRNRKNLIAVLNAMPRLKVIASHDLDMILDTCERCIVLDDGRVAYDGSTQAIMRNEEFLQEHGLELPLKYS